MVLLLTNGFLVSKFTCCYFVGGVELDDKKRQILYSAMKFFSDKGYYLTSVQEIAKDCGISKGSLYKYFQSKEELYIEVFEFFQNKMFEKVMNIQFEDSLTKKEQLEQQIYVEMEDFFEKKDFIIMQFKELPHQENEQLMPLFHRTRVRMMNWRRQTLSNAYGEQIDKYIWDLAVIFQGILKEFLLLMLNEDKYVSLKDLSKSIVKRMDAIVESYGEEEESLLTDSDMSEYQSSKNDSNHEEKQHLIIDKMEAYIATINTNGWYQKELTSTLALLTEELNKKDSKLFLIHALLAYLEKESGLKGYVFQLEKLIEKNKEI